jgi:O-antigen/teichoic acid export membrane protein
MSLGRNASVNLAGSIAATVVGLVAIPFYLDAIGTEKFGVLAIAWLFLGTFGFLDLGLTRATQYRIAALRNASRQARSAALSTSLLIAAPVSMIGYVAIFGGSSLYFASWEEASRLRQELLGSAHILAAAWPVIVFSAVMNGALVGRERFVAVNISTTASSVGFQILPLFAAWSGYADLQSLLSAALLGRAFPLLWQAPLTARHFLAGTRISPSRIETGHLVRYGGWATVASLVSTGLLMADRFLIGSFLGPVAVTIYSVPFQLSQRVAIIPTALTGALFPRLATAQTEERSRLALAVLQTLIIVLTPPLGAALVLLRPFFDMWLGSDLAAQCRPVAVFLIVGAWWNALAAVSFSQLQGIGRPRSIALVLACESAPYFALLWFGITYFGVVGGAAAFAVRCFVDFILLSRAAMIPAAAYRIAFPPLLALTLQAAIGTLYDHHFELWIGLGSASIAVSLFGAYKFAPEPLRMHLRKLL